MNFYGFTLSAEREEKVINLDYVLDLAKNGAPNVLLGTKALATREHLNYLFVEERFFSYMQLRGVLNLARGGTVVVILADARLKNMGQLG